MRPTAVLRAARVPLIQFRYGKCNVAQVVKTAPAPTPAPPKPTPSPAPTAAPRTASGPAKPLGPNVHIKMYGSMQELPKEFHRTPVTAEEMEIINLGGAVDPPAPPPKKKAK